jgi:hypothetical protein
VDLVVPSARAGWAVFLAPGIFKITVKGAHGARVADAMALCLSVDQ